ncbi:Heparin sulfate O-sulfotransferase [Paragonimus heterotremus]|uniref:Heparin sulfate O-sulfotransferase n=1 Tax=Paragonimus heterotremus TaxID=100268 RepID=A0A8J4T0T9_9TREM|nr:Heparin sulfate O-sulfotransferase [Paragonimus heterotremus]
MRPTYITLFVFTLIFFLYFLQIRLNNSFWVTSQHPADPGRFASVSSNLPMTSIYSSGFEPQLIVYNRIPKTGGTALVHLIYHLHKQNNVAITLLNISQNGFYLNLFNRMLLVRNISNRQHLRPLMLHGHFAYFNFPQFGSHIKPVYMNMIRDPLERLVSYYYFLRFGDDYRPHLVRRRMSNPSDQMQTFDDCVQTGGLDCHPNNLWVQVPFFCGHASYCRIPGNPVAVRAAKQRVTEDYLLVGLTEAFDEFVILLEKLLPRFFSGSSDLIRRTHGWRMRRTRYKPPIGEKVKSLFHSNPVWQAEQEFYEFVRTEFWNIRNSLLQGSTVVLNGSVFNGTPVVWNKQQIFFTRTRPLSDQ